MDNRRILVIGSSNTDMTVQVDELPRPGETVLGRRFLMTQGGKGANQAVAARRLGGEVSFACKVGNDTFGDRSIAAYEKEGLDTRLVLRTDVPSGVALIPVSRDGENAIVVASGANATFSVQDVERTMETAGDFDILLLQLEIPVDSVVRAARIAHGRGATVVLNPAPYLPLPETSFADIDLFIPNETELARCSGLKVCDKDSAAAACSTLAQKGLKRIIVTLGGKGALIYDNGVTETVPAHRVDVVDTTAAGDTFCGGLCVALAEGRTLRDAVSFATAAAALTVQKPGAQCAIPYRRDL